jgi:hypothetical protein
MASPENDAFGAKNSSGYAADTTKSSITEGDKESP